MSVEKMYICICNALKDKELAAAAAGSDACGVGDVFRKCGSRPQCGKCLPDVADIIETAKASPKTQFCPAE